MKRTAFYGRKKELQWLEGLWDKRSSSLVVCSGRRRIGKSSLIEEFAERSKARFIEIEGLAPDEGVDNAVQLRNFCARLAAQTGSPEVRAENWAKAFDALSVAIKGRARTIVFLDEVSWMGAFDKTFVAHLKNAWDRQFSKRDNLVLVLCGSVFPWIADNILHSRAFVGRVSLDLRLGELTLGDCRQFWGKAAARTPLKEILDVLSVTGGVPKYLDEIRPSLSAAENVRRLCFDPRGCLFGDFERIFTDAFGRNADERAKVLKCLVDVPRSLKTLAGKLGCPANGHLSNALKELVAAGFVSVDRGLTPASGRAVREVRYRVRDNYLRFYLKYIEPKRTAIQNGSYDCVSLDDLPGWGTIMGLQFENLVRNNVSSLLPLIGMGDAVVTSVAPYCKAATRRGEGVRIDLLVQTRKSVCVVEIKRRERIPAEVEEEVRKKVVRLGLPRAVSVRTALVYDGKLAGEVRESGYFDYLIPAERLFEQELSQ